MSHLPSAAYRVLVVRNDKLGDFMLAWPALATLKQTCAKLHISVLVPQYTADMAKACPWVDEVLIDPGDKAGRDEQAALREYIEASNFAVMLTLFSTPRIGWLGWRAGIPTRIAPATKWAQIFYNVRIRQRRSLSAKPEYCYNIELAQSLLNRLGYVSKTPAEPPFWPLGSKIRTQARARLGAALVRVDHDAAGAAKQQLIVIHPGSGGSAVNLSLEQYASLARHVQQQATVCLGWLISAGPGEEKQANTLCRMLEAEGLKATRMPDSASAVALGHLLSGADLFIAGSTGPLHIAGCLNIATAGFYPAKRSATALRWQTCNAADKRLAFSPLPGKITQEDMAGVDIPAAAATIASFISQETQVSACSQ